MANYPIVTYSNLKHKVANGISGGVIQTRDEAINVVFSRKIGILPSYLASYNSPYNEITGTLNSNRELTQFKVMVTPAELDEYGPNIGNRATIITNIAANTDTNFIISITRDVFNGSASNTYRICLLAQCSLDLSWDCTQLFMVIDTNASFTNSYTEVEYLESTTSGQYLNTNVSWATDLVIEDSLMYLDLPINSGAYYINGVDQSVYWGVKRSGDKWGFTCGGTANQEYAKTNTRYDLTVNTNEKKLYVNGVLKDTRTAGINASGNLYLFTSKAYNSTSISYPSPNTRRYLCKIYKNGVLYRDFVPCIRNSDNKPGMYDRVNNVFYTNQGSGEFKYGPLKSVPRTYQQVEYIEGDGNQRMTPFRIDKTYSGSLTVGYKFTATSHTDAMYFSTITASLSAGQAYSLGYTGASSPLYIRWNQIANNTTQVSYTIPEICEITRTNSINGVSLGEVSLFAHSTSYKPWIGKIYSYWLAANGEYIFKLVPCYRRSDNAIGLFDLVNNQFYTNAGTGNFTKGNNVNNYNYIKYTPVGSEGYEVHNWN